MKKESRTALLKFSTAVNRHEVAGKHIQPALLTQSNHSNVCRNDQVLVARTMDRILYSVE